MPSSKKEGHRDRKKNVQEEECRKKGEEEEEDTVEYLGEDVGVLAAGTQKVGIQGEILRWHFEHGVQQMSAEEYIEQLEQEVAALRHQLAVTNDEESSPQQLVGKYAIGEHGADDPVSVVERDALESEILSFLKTLSSDTVAELTECASADVLEAMNVLVDRLIGRESGKLWQNKSECTSTELANILYWLMCVGHQLRDMEIRLSLTHSLQALEGATYGPDDGADDYGPSSNDMLPPGR